MRIRHPPRLRHLGFLRRWAWPSGLASGAVVDLFMFRAAIPLTLELKSHYLPNINLTPPPLRGSQFGIPLVCVGLAIALTVRHFTPARTKPSLE